jgi:RNA polymerase sigma-70 factor, ECF subfamily
MSIGTLYNQQFDKIYGFFYWKTFSKQNAEDLTSETFLIFAEKYAESPEDILDKEKFLFGIMRNVWLRHLQNKYKLNEVLTEDFDSFVSETVELEVDSTDEQRVMKFVERLPTKQAKVMRLRLINRLPLSEICTVLNKDMNYVKTTQRRGIANLKKLISEGGVI